MKGGNDYSLIIKISGALDKSLSKSVQEAQGMLSKLEGGEQQGFLGKLMSGAGKVAQNVAKASAASLGVMGAAATAAGTAAITTGMDFENAMADLAGTLGIDQTTETFAELEAAAREVGATTNKTSTEAAEALKYMALAGWDAETSIASLDAMVKLSSASGTDLARTSDLVTDSYAALGLTLEDYQSYMDMVARADSAANYTSEQFMETMIGAGGAARVLGVDLNELATAAGILANNGTKGSEAGTALNSMFARFAGNDKALDALAGLGISLYDANDQFIGMVSLLGQIKEGLAGMNAEAANATMKDLFGTHYMSEGQYLLDSINADGAWEALSVNLQNAYNGMDENGNAISTLQERYRVATNTMKGDMDILVSAASDFGIEIYKAMVGDENGEGGLRGAVQEITEIIGNLKTAFTQGGLDGLAGAIGDTVGDLAPALGDKGTDFVNSGFSFADTLINSIGSTENSAKIGEAAAKIITAIGTNFLTYTGDFAIAAGNLVMGLVGGLASDNAGEQIAEAASTVVTDIGDWFSENGGEFGTLAGTLIGQFAVGLASHSGDILSGGIDIAIGLAKGLIQGAVVLVSNAPAIIGNLVSAIIENIPNLFQAGLALAGALADGVASAGKNITKALIDALDTGDDIYGYEEYANESAENFANVQAAMAEIVAREIPDEMPAEIKATFDEALNALVAGTKSIDDVYAEWESSASGSDTEYALNQAMYYYQEFMGEAVEIAKSMPPVAQEAEASIDAVADAAEEAGTISTETQEAISAAQDGLTGLEGVSASMQTEFDAMKASAQETSAALSEALNTELTSAIGDDALGGLISAANNGTLDNVAGALNTAMETILTISNTTAEGVQTVMAAIIEADATMVEDAANTGVSLMQGLADGINANAHLAISAAQAVADRISSTIRTALKIHSPSQVMYDLGQYTGEGLALGISASENDVRDAALNTAGNAMLGTSAGVSESGSGGAGGGDVIFSPQITIQGNVSESDIRSVLIDSMEQFRVMYNRLMAEQARTAF